MSDNFLSRWSRLKSESKEEPAAPAPLAEQAADAEPPPPDPVPQLPPIESLTAQSDFSAFLQSGVPDHLRKAALSKLWTSDPLFTQPEVFDLHMEDYNLHPLGEAVKTAWEMGKGIVEKANGLDQTASLPPDAENSHIKTNLEDESTPES
jgi:hypothetical protein